MKRSVRTASQAISERATRINPEFPFLGHADQKLGVPTLNFREVVFPFIRGVNDNPLSKILLWRVWQCTPINDSIEIGIHHNIDVGIPKSIHQAFSTTDFFQLG